MIAVVALVLALAGQAQQTPPRDTRPGGVTPTGRITGVVVSDERQPRPLRRARVVVTGAGLDTPRTAITADDGAFAFDGLPDGRFTVAANKEAYVSTSYGATRPARPGPGVQVAAGQTVTVTLRMTRGAVITGTVLDVDGHPAAGISVLAVYPRLGSGFLERQYVTPPGVIPAVTDDRGVYRIYGLPAGEYVVVTRSRVLQTGASVVMGDVRMMTRGGTLSRPMALAPVLHPGVADMSRATRITLRPAEERAGIDVQLEIVPLASVTGTVASPLGWARAAVTLWRMEDTTLPQNGSVATPDEQGRFTFRNVPPGTYRVGVRVTQQSGGGRGGGSGGDVQYGFADVVVNGEDIDGVGLSLQPGLTIAGQVVFESSQAATPALPPQLRLPTPILLANTSGGWPMPSITIEGTRFRIDGVVPGAYRVPTLPPGVRAAIGQWWLKSLTAGGRDLLDAPLTLQQSIDDAIVTFTDRASEVSGILRDAQGAVVNALYVVAFPVDRSGWFFNSRRIAAVRPGRDGHWSIRNLPPGDYRVAAADLDQNEWFDPAVLDRLLSGATALGIGGPDKYTIDLVLR